MNTPNFTRRELLRNAALGALALPLIGASAHAAEEKGKGGKEGKGGKAGKGEAASPTLYPPSSPDGRENGLRLGIASYSVRNLSLDDAIATVVALRVKNIALFRLHCDWEKATIE